MEKRKQARVSLLGYARLLQGPPVPSEQQPAREVDSEDSAGDDDGRALEAGIEQDPLNMPGGAQWLLPNQHW